MHQLANSRSKYTGATIKISERDQKNTLFSFANKQKNVIAYSHLPNRNRIWTCNSSSKVSFQGTTTSYMIQTHQEKEKGKEKGRGRRNQAKNHEKRSPALKTDLQENVQETKISKLPKQELSQQNHQQFSGNYGIANQQMQPRIMCQGENFYSIQLPHQNFLNPPQIQNPPVQTYNQTYNQNMPPTPTYPQRHQPNTFQLRLEPNGY